MKRYLLSYAFPLLFFIPLNGQTLTLSDGICFVSSVFNADGTYGGRTQFTMGSDVIRWESNKWVIRRSGALLYDNLNNTLLPPCSSVFSWFDHAGCDFIAPLNLTGNCSTVLPIVLAEFNVSINEERTSIIIDWLLADYNTFDYFSLQVSTESDNTWKTLTTYSLEDPILEYQYEYTPEYNDIYRFRLIEHSDNDAILIQKSIEFRSEQSRDLVIAPNPSRHTITFLNWSDDYMGAHYQITNASGYQISRVGATLNAASLSVQHLPSGLYHLTIHFEDGIQRHCFMVY